MKKIVYSIFISLLLSQTRMTAFSFEQDSVTVPSYSSLTELSNSCAYESESDSDSDSDWEFDGFSDDEIAASGCMVSPSPVLEEKFVKTSKKKSSLKKSMKSCVDKVFTRKNAIKTGETVWWGTKKTLEFSWSTIKFLGRSTVWTAQKLYSMANTTCRVSKAAYKAYYDEEEEGMELYVDGKRVPVKGNRVYISTTRPRHDLVRV